jgi:hypothetical protein
MVYRPEGFLAPDLKLALLLALALLLMARIASLLVHLFVSVVAC